MEKVLLAGATGNLGKEIARELIAQNYAVSCVIRNQQRARVLRDLKVETIPVNVRDAKAMQGICNGFDIVVSALGKSVSPNDKTKPTFNDVDLGANSILLEDAKRSGVKKFVYVSALHSEKYQELEYFRVHHQFSELLKQSGINYSIVKPPAIFSAYRDMITMAKQGRLVNIGSGGHTTNPIYEGDLAKVCVDAIKKDNAIIEAGGKTVYTRKQLNEIIQKTVAPNKTLWNVPLSLFQLSLSLIKLVDKNAYDKFAFFAAVIQDDLLAPKVGEMRFEEYVKKNSRS